MYIPRADALRQSKRARVRFLLAEIETGLSFLSIARSTPLLTSRERYLQSAREVYGIVLRLLPGVEPAPGERLELNTKMEALRSGLVAAGCSLDPSPG